VFVFVDQALGMCTPCAVGAGMRLCTFVLVLVLLLMHAAALISSSFASGCCASAQSDGT